MNRSSKFSCFLIGEGSLLVQCATIIRRGGHEICGVLSTNDTVKAWAQEEKVELYSDKGNFAEVLGARPFDYLFSIVNEHILTEEILGLPRKLAVNYHDALLPRYAGTHATSWALMNREIEHGISWHVMAARVDAGDILKQRRITVTPDETALSLNAKCYEAAIEAFSELVGDLAHEKLATTKQATEGRSFFPRYKRPPAACLISWTRDAEDIEALTRALDFGHVLNPLGLPKVLIGDDVVLVSKLDILDSTSIAAPGTITGIDDDHIRVSTSTHDVALRKLLTFEGKPATVPAVVNEHRLREGDRLENPQPNLAARLSSLNAACSRHEAFWVERLTTRRAISLPFPTLNQGLTRGTSRATPTVTLTQEVRSFLSRQGQGWRADQFLTGVYATYLARILGAGQVDIGFTYPQLKIETAELERLFAGQVPVRFDIEDGQRFGDVLRDVQEELSRVTKHKTFSHDVAARYPELRALSAQKDGQRLPFALELTDQLTTYDADCESVLTLLVDAKEGSYRWVYDGALLDEEMVSRIARQFETLLRALVSDATLRVAELPIMSEEERYQVTVEWNETAADYPKHRCIHQLFEDQVKRTPEALALVSESHRFTYRELNSRANKVANHLRTLGIGPETLVGICVDRSVEMAAGVLAILKAGGAYLPLDPSYPHSRLSFMLEDAGVSVLLTQEHLVERLPNFAGSIVRLDADWETIAQESEENPVTCNTTDNLAYVIYTSGSTGKPKGVLITHEGLVNHSTAGTSHYSLHPGDRVLQFSSLSFDVAGEELFPTWLSGASVVLKTEEAEVSFQGFHRFLEREKVTVVNLPSPFWHEWVDELSSAQLELPESLRLVVVGSEKVLASRLKLWQKLATRHIRWINAYGPTEATIGSTAYELQSDEATTGGMVSVPIGRPTANKKLYILDGNLQPVPVGMAGEIHIGGVGLARGYLNRPELTAEKFITDPFSAEAGARLYKTGDRARYLANGQIEFLDRLDHQVKIRGFRIELGEIEERLCEFPGVRSAAVIAREDTLGDTRLFAYIVSDEKVSPNGAVRDFLAERLPGYMLPSAIVLLDELPVTPNGKIDRRALPVPADWSEESSRNILSPRNATEEMLAGIWAKLLKIQQVSVQDNFFELGGHSLLAVRMFSEIEKVLGKSLPIATLFQAPTIEKLAGCLRDEEGNTDWSSLVAIQPKGDKLPFFCVHAAGGNVLFYRDLARHLEPDQPFYGLQAQGLDGKRPRHTSVEEMAAFYIQEMRRVQPEGPYCVGGGSFGGLVAYEIARQLDAEGHEVGLVALFDTYGPGYPKNLPSTTTLRKKLFRLLSRIENHAGNLGVMDWKGRVSYIRSKRAKARVMAIRAYKKKLEKFKRKIGVIPPSALPGHLQQTEDAIRRCSENYAPQPFPGRLTLFRAMKQPLGIYPEPELGWRPFVTGSIEIHDVPGIHGSILSEPRVQVLAQTFTECLHRTQSLRPHVEFREPLRPESDSCLAAAGL